MVTIKRKKILKEFADTTSAHGFILISKSNHKLKRILWILITIFAWIICSYQIWVAIAKYFQYQTVVSVQIRHLTNVSFPAVTICNLNPIRSSWLVNEYVDIMLEEVKNAKKLGKLSNNEWEKLDEEYRHADHITPEMQIVYKHLRLIYEKNINLSVAGHKLEDMLLECTFQSTKCTAKNFTRWEHGTYGNCYTMIVSSDQYNSFVGPLYGLSLTLYVADNEYLARHSQGAGFKVEIHPPEYVPFPEDKGFTISPGVMTSVGLKQMRISRMPFPYDGTDCGDSQETLEANSWASGSLYYKRYLRLLRSSNNPERINYTAQSCVKSCYQRQLVHDCGCIDPSFVTREDVDEFYNFTTTKPFACDMVLEKSLKCVRKSIGKTTDKGLCDAECPQPCHEQDYIARIATSLWPRASYFNRIRDTWKDQIPSAEMMQEASMARTNLAKLEIYYEELNYQSIIESAAQDIWYLLSNIGGTLGLYVGVSFLTLGEFTELFLKYVFLPATQHIQQRALSIDAL